MITKNLITFFICCISFVVKGQVLQNKINDPTGTYKTHFNNADGKQLPQGTIKIKLIKQDNIVISLIMQNGEPSLRSGQLMDTLSYKKSHAVFKNSEFDSTCKIVFAFTLKGVQVRQTSKFTNGICDFADGVNVNGFYFKESSKVPEFKIHTN